MAYSAAVWSIALYAILSPLTLLSIGWLYLGGGSELEKIHPATYLLVAILPLTMIFSPRFRSNTIQLLRDPSFLLFIIGCFSTATYAILVKQVSAAPFVDTFLSTILVVIIALAMPRRPLLQLRAVFDIVILTNVVLMFVEFATQQSFFMRFYTGPVYDVFGPTRWTGLLGLPLSAAQLLAAYSLITFVAAPISLSWAGLSRILFSFLSLLACLLTGGRTSVAFLVGLLLLYICFSTIRQLVSGYVNPLGAAYLLIGLVFVALSLPILNGIGLFDILTARLEDDYGSGLAREAAFRIIENLSASDLWLGIEAGDALALQQSYGLIAVEIAWANFILICGLVFTVPLFVGFCLFHFQFLPKHCAPSVVFIGAFTLALTFAYNSIWSKTTVLAVTVAIAISNLRWDVPEGVRSLRDITQGSLGFDADT